MSTTFTYTYTHKKIYVATSWRNQYQPQVVKALRQDGHDVYDFRHPAEGDDGFQWAECDARLPVDPSTWTVWEFRRALQSPAAKRGYDFDKTALDWCDTGVLVLPSGRSAHLEGGYLVGRGVPLHILVPYNYGGPDLMVKMADSLVYSINDLLMVLRDQPDGVSYDVRP